MPSDSVGRMDSSGAGVEENIENLLSSSPGNSSIRERTESESSDKQTKFVLPSTDGSPPKVLTLDDVVNVVKNIQNMTLAHEIALNPEFKLQPYEPPENSLEKRIKDVMHKAFWDVLREQLKSIPPSYENAIQLLGDIKECFPQIILANNKKILDHINEVLDTAVVRQQAERGVLDFRAYANFVVQIMAKSCAPARDEQIKKLSEVTDVVETFKGILEIMAVMKLDMANYLLDFARNDILANSVEYERAKFREYLEYYKFGFPVTESWLKRNQTVDANGVSNSVDQTVFSAFMELIKGEYAHDFPEILSNDQDRILKLRNRALRLFICASCYAVCLGISLINQRKEILSLLSTQIPIILQNVTKESELVDGLENVYIQIQSVLNNRLKDLEQPSLNMSTENTIKTQILQMANCDSPIRSLMWNRLQTYFQLAFSSKNNSPPPPPGYLEFQDELEGFAAALKRVISYNLSVFGEYFNQILTTPESFYDGSNAKTT